MTPHIAILTCFRVGSAPLTKKDCLRLVHKLPGDEMENAKSVISDSFLIRENKKGEACIQGVKSSLHKAN